MAYVPEEAVWTDGVYRLERKDPVLGGEGGVSNKNITDLACRTVWLKKQIEDLATQVSDTNDDLYEQIRLINLNIDDVRDLIAGLQINVADLYVAIDDVEEYLTGLNTIRQATLTLDSVVASGSSIELPNGFDYYVGTNSLGVFWQGVKCALGKQFDEGEANDDGKASSITALFDMKAGSVLEFWIMGHSTVTIRRDGADPDEYESLIDRVAALEKAVAEIREELVMRDASEIFEETLEEK